MPEVNVLSLHGEIDISQKRWIEQELGRVERFDPATATIIDLRDVRYLDTTFLNALLSVRNRMENERPASEMSIVVPRFRPFSRLFAMTNLDRVFKTFDDMPAAMRHAGSEHSLRVHIGLTAQ